MRMRMWVIWTITLGFAAGMLRAADDSGAFSLGGAPATNATNAVDPFADPGKPEPRFAPFWLAVVDAPPSVYPEIMPPREPEDTNNGGVNFLLNVDWLNKYVYRGVDQSTLGRNPENAAQFDVSAEFDLGKIPHPFIGLFVNVFNNDPISRFEEVRPYFGLDWNLKPITIRGGFDSYIYPNRKNKDTQEVFLSLKLNDGFLFHSAQPIFTPYIYGAYDFSLYNGFYIEAGVRHDFIFEDFGCSLSPIARLAYVVDDSYFALNPGSPSSRDHGLQHYDVGVIGKASINHVLHVDRKYGEWSVVGTLFYTGRLDVQLRADTEVWGGVGLEFKY